MKPKVYLAGYAKEVRYRDYAIEKYSDELTTFDPMREIEEELEKIKDYEKRRKVIIIEDKKAILDCDILVAFIQQWSCGTIMEILFAYNNNMPVYVIEPDYNLIIRQDYWLSYHADKIFDSIDECMEFIIREHKE